MKNATSQFMRFICMLDRFSNRRLITKSHHILERPSNWFKTDLRYHKRFKKKLKFDGRRVSKCLSVRCKRKYVFSIFSLRTNYVKLVKDEEKCPVAKLWVISRSQILPKSGFLYFLPILHNSAIIALKIYTSFYT